MVDGRERTLSSQRISPLSILRQGLFGLAHLLLSYLSIEISLGFLSGPADELLLIDLQIQHGSGSYCLCPSLDVLYIKRQPINEDGRALASSHQACEMCNDLPERQFLAILRRNQLLLHRCKVWLIFNMPISHLAGNKLSSTALPHTGCTAHQKVLSPGSHLTIEGQLRIHLLPPTSLQEVYGGVVGLAELVVISTHEIRELPEASRVGLELGKFLRSEGVIRNDDLASGKIEEDDLCKEEVLIVFCLGLVGLPPQHLLDLEDIQQEGISLLSVLLDCLPLPRLVHIHI